MTHHKKLARRTVVGSLCAGLATILKPLRGWAAKPDWMTDPERVLDTYIRMQADRSGEVAPWSFHGYVAAIPRDAPSQILFACEGAETKKVFVRDKGFELWSKVMTMFKDPETGEILSGKSWKNPFTGETNTVEPNVIGSVTQLYVSDDGKVMEERSINGAPASPVELTLDFLVLGDKVQIDTYRNPPRVRPNETVVFATNTADLSDILDMSRPRIEATFSGSDVVPWQRFMNMPQGIGHAIWHTNGKKMHGFDDLSPEYLEQAQIHIPDVLAWAEM